MRKRARSKTAKKYPVHGAMKYEEKVAEAAMRNFTKELVKQQKVIASGAQNTHAIKVIAQHFRILLSDRNFLAIARAEGFCTMPRPLASLLTKAPAA